MTGLRAAVAGQGPVAIRRWWLAAALSVSAPGLGHLYAGYWHQALAVVLAWAVIGPLCVWLSVRPHGGPAAILAGTFLVIVALLAVPIHAALAARSGRALPLDRWLRIGLFLVIFAAWSEAGSSGTGWLRADISQPFEIISSAMSPTLQEGDQLFVETRPYTARLPARGDVIVFLVARAEGHIVPADARPDLRREFLVLRIVGLPGDRVKVTPEGVWLNRVRLPRSPASRAQSVEPEVELFEESLDGRTYTIATGGRVVGSRGHTPPTFETTVEPGRYFVLGDNRDAVEDSRSWGTVALGSIVGRASHLYYSTEPGTGRIKWSRLGKSIR